MSSGNHSTSERTAAPLVAAVRSLAARGSAAGSVRLATLFEILVNTFNTYEYDLFQALDLRVTLGGGVGVKVVKSDRATLGLVAGADYDRSRFSTPLTRNSAEAFWGDDYTLKIGGASSLMQSFRMFDNLSDLGASRVNFDVTVSTKLLKWLSWNVSLSDRYLSTPVAGRKTNDFLYSTGVGVAFVR
jgi:hypothetical protein